MSPPFSLPLAAENEYWTDEAIFTSLQNFKTEKPLPANVDSGINPYQYRPQDLPGDLWYFCSTVKKESDIGFWQETGEPCEIFSNSAISGFRTTLRFYEGNTAHGRKTDWVMQEYRITEKYKTNMNDDHRALCRVFLAVENSPEMECILTGDYLELNDLVDDPSSSSSSSTNSSCLTMTSDEYFDSMALLQQLDDDENMKDSSIVKFNLSAHVNSKLVICPITTLSLKNESVDAKEEGRNERTSIGVDMITESSSSSEEEKKKENVIKTKKPKIMKFLCLVC